jgi:hypothetical protein
MDQQASLVFKGPLDSPTDPAWTGLTHVILCAHGRSEPPDESLFRDEADYWLARAQAEAIRADEAACLAAQRPHLELALLYHRHAVSIRQAGDDAVQEWTSEGGNWLVEG